jgi:hypothetical protein
MTSNSKEQASILLSSQVFNEYQQLKNVIKSLTDQEDISDDKLIMSLVGSFMQSLYQSQHIHSNKVGGCCGGNCHSDKDNKSSCC